jgi:hypothetical protein
MAAPSGWNFRGTKEQIRNKYPSVKAAVDKSVHDPKTTRVFRDMK